MESYSRPETSFWFRHEHQIVTAFFIYAAICLAGGGLGCIWFGWPSIAIAGIVVGGPMCFLAGLAID